MDDQEDELRSASAACSCHAPEQAPDTVDASPGGARRAPPSDHQRRAASLRRIFRRRAASGA